MKHYRVKEQSGPHLAGSIVTSRQLDDFWLRRAELEEVEDLTEPVEAKPEAAKPAENEPEKKPAGEPKKK